MADLRIEADPQATLVAVEAGDALRKADKSLYQDPVSGDLWRRRSDGTFQIIALSIDNTTRIESGRLATLTFVVSGPSAVFRFAKRPQVLAPPGADAAIQSTDYAAAVVLIGQ
jgi:hypothetical protein